MLRPFTRGMGDVSPCGGFTSWLCSTGKVSMVGGVPCTDCAATAPTLASGSVSPGLPSGYDPSTGEISDNPSGATEVNQYSPIYPDLAPVNSNGACDWTKASWIDITTWCGANWMMAGIVGLGLVLMLKGKR